MTLREKAQDTWTINPSKPKDMTTEKWVKWSDVLLAVQELKERITKTFQPEIAFQLNHMIDSVFGVKK